MTLASRNELLKNEEQRGQEQHADAALEKEPVVNASVGTKRDELENAVADAPHDILDHARS